jgi:hypothetical protein
MAPASLPALDGVIPIALPLHAVGHVEVIVDHGGDDFRLRGLVRLNLDLINQSAIVVYERLQLAFEGNASSIANKPSDAAGLGWRRKVTATRDI